MVTCMDDEIGKVVAALDTRKMRENTLIVFMSARSIGALP